MKRHVVAALIVAMTLMVWGVRGIAEGATLTLTKTTDTNDGVCDADCSLREAIATADPGDTVDIPAGIYTLALGTLTISKTAYVKAKIVGDSISIAGKVEGNIEAKKDLRLMAGARIEGDITTPILSVEAGAVFEGRCNMSSRQEAGGETLSIGGLASHLNLEPAEVVKLADSGKIPGSKAGDQWTFKKKEIDTWLANQK